MRKVKTASGATAVQIAERRGGRDHVLDALHRVQDVEQLDAEVCAVAADDSSPNSSSSRRKRQKFTFYI